MLNLTLNWEDTVCIEPPFFLPPFFVVSVNKFKKKNIC